MPVRLYIWKIRLTWKFRAKYLHRPTLRAKPIFLLNQYENIIWKKSFEITKINCSTSAPSPNNLVTVVVAYATIYYVLYNYPLFLFLQTQSKFSLKGGVKNGIVTDA